MDAERTVLMTTDTVGGVWTYAIELANGLAAHGVPVHLATMGGPVTERQREQVAGVHGLVLHESAFRLEWMQDPWKDVAACGEWLLQLEHEIGPALVHLNQFAFGALPFVAPTLLVAHSCVLSWWRAVRGEAAPSEWDEYHVRVTRGLAHAGLVAAPTQAMLRTLSGNYGFHRDGAVLPNGRDPQLFEAAGKQPYILAAGRFWDEAKNLAALEAVAPRLAWPVNVAGSCVAPHGGMLEPRGVEALGELAAPALAQAMARASIYCLPARYEPFGLSVLEAGLCGCALVLGDIDSLREVWGDAALFVAPDDHAALRGTLARLIDSPAERARLGRAARERALHFTAERMVHACLEAYTRLEPRFAPLAAEEPSCA